MRVLGPDKLIGREWETGAARDWMGLLGSGPAALLISGEAGIGKTSLWSAAVDLAREAGARVLVSRPAEAEMPMGYAALGDLLEPVTETVLEGLTEPLAAALGGALLLRRSEGPAEALVVARAVLAALRLLAGPAPVVVAVDDAQWLDPATSRALAFAARRLTGDRVGFAVSVRDGHTEPIDCTRAFGARMVPVAVRPLGVGATAHLLRTRVDPHTPRHAVQRIHERSGGNPFYSLQLAGSPDTERLPPSLRTVVMARLDAVDPAANDVVEQATVVGPSPVSAFADEAGLDAALADGVLVTDQDEVRFAHPILAAAVYERLGPARRRALHARAADASPGLEEKARHLALAADGPDAVAAELIEAAARLAGSRGAPESATDLAAHAVRLTPDPDQATRLRRLADLADYRLIAGDEPAAREAVELVLAGGASGTVRVRALLHAALLAQDARTAVSQLELASSEPMDDPRLAARTLSQLAWQRGAWLGDIAPAYAESVAAVALAERLGDPSVLVSTLTTAGLLGTFADDPQAEVHFERALDLVGELDRPVGDHTPRIAYAHLCWWRGDWARAAALLDAERADADRRGDEGLLTQLDIFGAEFAIRRGQWAVADGLLATALGEARDYWRVVALVRRAILRGRRGDPAATEDAAEIDATPFAAADPVIAAAADFARGLGMGHDGPAGAAGHADAVAELMLRLPRAANATSARAVEYAVFVPETVGALVEAGRSHDARSLLDDLEKRGGQLGAWGAAALDLCRGLLLGGDGDSAAALAALTTARAAFDGLDAPWELALSLLAEGRALRRLGRRRDAGVLLERAADVFDRLGAEPARQRALDELARARPRPRQDNAPTAAERRVAALVSSGLTNREVAARLSTSVATVEAHLTRVYSKVGVRSRTQLARLVADGRLDLDS